LIGALDIVVPLNNFLAMFDQTAKPITDLIGKLHCKNTTLRQTRDLLLPRLISGEVDVSALAIDLGKE
jgi:type I restriction enzyme S subunit